MILFDATKENPVENNHLLFWLNSIQSRAPKSIVCFIGTHWDYIPEGDRRSKLKQINREIKNLIELFVSNQDTSEFIQFEIFENDLDEKLYFWPCNTRSSKDIKKISDCVRQHTVSSTVSSNFKDLVFKIEEEY